MRLFWFVLGWWDYTSRRRRLDAVRRYLADVRRR